MASVGSPFTAAGGRQVSRDGTTAYATVSFEQGVSDTQIARVKQLATAPESASLHIALNGQAFTVNPKPNPVADAMGIALAFVVLLFVFRAVWVAAPPIITAIAGVGTSAIAVMLLSHVIALSDTTLTLGSLIGLGVGIDYALFIVNRHRTNLMAGMSVGESIATSLNTSGRAVVFAGLTVVVALLGMLTLNVGIINGMAIGAAVTVVLTVLAAITLLPALLGLIGTRVLSRRERRALTGGRAQAVSESGTGLWGRWARRVQARPKTFGLVALALRGEGQCEASAERSSSHAIDEARGAEPGLAVVEVAAADDETAFAVQELLAGRWATATADTTNRAPGEPGVRLRCYLDVRWELGTWHRRCRTVRHRVCAASSSQAAAFFRRRPPRATASMSSSRLIFDRPGTSCSVARWYSSPLLSFCSWLLPPAPRSRARTAPASAGRVPAVAGHDRIGRRVGRTGGRPAGLQTSSASARHRRPLRTTRGRQLARLARHRPDAQPRPRRIGQLATLSPTMPETNRRSFTGQLLGNRPDGGRPTFAPGPQPGVIGRSSV
ncbi:DUF6207 family protein [Streptomyces misionensis]|uniref:DUF6207 family protein n=1 Tax=Streptomyces misionensis TaxID=67331 RepID=UPI00244BCC4A|nr:DUF6207 family protein [Streptomyces misionensis]